MAQIRRLPSGKYFVRIRRKGYPEQSEAFNTKGEAQAWSRQIEGQLDKGIVIDTREAGRTTLLEALTRYASEVTSTKRGRKQEETRIKRWKATALAKRTLISIRGGDMATYRDKRIEEGAGGNTIRLELAIISNLYTVARTEWKMEGLANPVRDIRKPKAPRGRSRRLLDGEEDKLLKAAEPILREAIILAVETAMRRGELCSLTRDQIDKKRRVAKLDMTKNGDSREVPLSARAMEAINALPVPIDGSLLGVTPDWLSHAFIDLRDGCGIKGLRLHDLRREGISRLFEKGWSLEEVRAVSGHKTIQMLTVYSRLKADDLVKKIG